MSRVGGGVRNKPRTSQDVCADCGAPEPGWASINRGILICDECCSVHRSLGRHISQIKSLKKGTWNPLQHAMVHTLYSSGANTIWEHTLLDPSVAKTGRRKPTSKDPVHPTKADFIRAKHQMLAYVYRPSRDDPVNTDSDLSRQLHSSVRTSNLETSLKLLSQGADPNYYHKDKSCCPLHVAARAGQSSQVELLIIYGADPGAIDSHGNTPAHYASDSSHPELADHLSDSQYEVTDRLAFYLSGRKPDHASGQHWVIPEMADSLDMSDLAKEARAKLQSLPNHLFEELACDVYDEVDRRETDAIWISLQNQSALVSDRCTVPFLPVNPDFSSTRNQGRQKLARFNAREFATLIIDILSDAKRRQSGMASPGGSKDKDMGDMTMTLSNSPKINSHHQNNNINSINARLITPPNSATFPPSSTSSNPPSSPHLKNKDSRLQVNSLTSLSSTTTTSDSNTTTTTTTTTDSSNTTANDTAASGPSSLNSYFNNTNSPYHHHHHSHHSNTGTPLHNTSTHQHHSLTNPPHLNNVRGEVTDDGEPLYDSVASEDDYTYVEQMQKLALQTQILEEQRRQHQPDELVYSEPNSECGPVSLDSAVSLETFLEVKERLQSSQVVIQELQHNNAHMRSRLDHLSTTVKNLQEENRSLRSMYSSSGVVGGSGGPSSLSSTPPPSLYSNPACAHNGDSDHKSNLRCSRGVPQRPISMFEPRQGPPNVTPCPGLDHTRTSYHLPPVRMSGEYDNSRSRSPSLEATETTPLNTSYGLPIHDPHASYSLPSQEEVVKKTEVITKRIQELLISAQEGRQEKFMPCADQIHSAVLDMDAIFPKGEVGAGVQGSLRQLVSSAGRLQNECRAYHHHHSTPHALDPRFVTQQVIQCAYDIAKGAKTLVTLFQ